MAEFKLSNVAKEDLIRIYQYGCEKFGARQAEKYYHHIWNKFDEINKNLYSFESVSYIREGYRRCVIGPDSIYFRIKDERIEIMAIVGRQDIDRRL